ncbi:hypothetical protein BH10PSE6_BH10PSE6_02300 [soil metagenome]
MALSGNGQCIAYVSTLPLDLAANRIINGVRGINRMM